MILVNKHLSLYIARCVCLIVFCALFVISFSSDLAARSERCTVNAPCLVKVRADEFKSIKTFYSVNVGPLKGSAENLGLSRAELIEHVQKLFRDNFADMDFNEKLLPFTVDEPRDLGYVHFTIRTVEEDGPVILHILLRSGNHAMVGKGMAIVQIYDEDRLELSSRETISHDVRQILGEMMEDLAGQFYGVR